jgi:hypothetical protein
MSREPAQVVCEIKDLVQTRLQEQNRQEQRGHELREQNWLKKLAEHI